MKKEILPALKSLALALLFIAGVSYAWTGPTAAPPDSNVAPPINVGASAQVKAGGFSAGSLTSTNGRVNLRSQDIYGDDNSALYYSSNNDTATQMAFRDAQNEQYGRVYGSGDGANFGLLDGDANWSYLAVKDNYTQLRINNSAKFNVWVDGRVGAAQYCNLGGTSCVSAGTLGGMSSAGRLYHCAQAGAYNSGCVGQLQLNDADCDADMTIGGSGTIRACTYVGDLVIQ